MESEEHLHARGWSRRGILSEPRLSEMKALYDSLGFEVLLKGLDEMKLEGECCVCFTEDPDRFKVLYTRPKTSSARNEDDWPGL